MLNHEGYKVDLGALDGHFLSTPTSRISMLSLANPNHACHHLPQKFGVHMNVLSIVKVKILLLVLVVI